MAKKRGERKDKEANHRVIRDAFLDILKDKVKAPTIKELEAATGLSHNTIKAHLKELKFEPEQSPWRMLSPEILEAIYKSAISLNPGSQADRKLWMQLVEGWSEKTSTDVTSGGEPIKQTIKIGDKEITFE